jgi:hypothetical protein
MQDIIIVLVGAILLWDIILTVLYAKQQKLFSNLTEGISKQDLKTILQKVSQNQKAIAEHAKDLEAKLELIVSQDKFHFQKIGFMRFNPYSDTGGDQSFSLCLLDEHNNGLIITSLHGREQTRIYAKLVKQGKAHHDFFEEEKQVLSQAINSGHSST